jgi:hypothetical protein
MSQIDKTSEKEKRTNFEVVGVSRRYIPSSRHGPNGKRRD